MANGAVKRRLRPFESQLETQESHVGPFWRAYAEPNLLLVNDGTGRFVDASDTSENFGSVAEVSRGLAHGDIDNDGDLDLLVTNISGPARLLRNDTPKAGGWLIVRAFDPALNRDVYGAVVTVVTTERRLVRVANPGGSYQSSSDPRAHFGLPVSEAIEHVMIQWPGGHQERFRGIEPNRVVVLNRGTGAPVE